MDSKSLNDSGKLPFDAVTLQKVKSAAFWSGEWPTEELDYLKASGLYLVAAEAYAGSSTYPQPVRWIGAFKEIDGKWQYATLSWPGLYVPPGIAYESIASERDGPARGEIARGVFDSLGHNLDKPP